MKFELPFILDGATGTAIQKRGFNNDRAPETWTLENPEIMQEIQGNYFEAGSNAVYAPTFGANPVKMKEYGLADQVKEYNKNLVAISRAAADKQEKEVFVGGDITGVGKFLYPVGDATFQQLYDIYKEQAEALAEAGVDFFAVETMMTVPETRAAVLAIKDTCDAPIIVSMTCNEKGKTLTGTDVCAGLVIFQEMGASAYGLNCSVGPDKMLAQIQRLSEYANIPLIAKPNAGMPELVDGVATYNCPPEEFTAYVDELLEAGVGLFGGCCGTDESHIAALKAKLDGKVVKAPCSEYADAIVLATEREAFVFDEEIEFSDVLELTEDFAEDVDEALEDDPDVLMILLEDEEGLEYFIENQIALTAPICICGGDIDLLEKALFNYQGIAMYSGEISPEKLAPLKEKYGLVYAD